jgi:hypothetical protein
VDITHREKIMKRIKKLLDRAESNYSAEADSALLKAQQLMIQNGISKDDIEDIDLQPVIEKQAYHSQTSLWQGKVAYIIAANFRCKCYWHIDYQSGTKKKIMTFVGFEEDTVIATEAYLYAIALVNRNIRKIRKRYPRVTIKYLNTYKTGFLDGLHAKFKDQVEKNDWGLVLVTPVRVTEYFSSLGTVPTKTRKIVESKNENAYQQGFLDGKAFNVYAEIV